MNRAYLRWSGLRSPADYDYGYSLLLVARGFIILHLSRNSSLFPGWPGVERRQDLHSRTWNGPSFIFPLQLQNPRFLLPLFCVAPLAPKVRRLLILCPPPLTCSSGPGWTGFVRFRTSACTPSAPCLMQPAPSRSIANPRPQRQVRFDFISFWFSDLCYSPRPESHSPSSLRNSLCVDTPVCRPAGETLLPQSTCVP